MKIILSDLANAQMRYMFRSVETEIGALCSGYIVPEKHEVYIQRIYMTEQKITASDVDFDQTSCTMTVLKAMRRDEVIIGWIHSHGEHGVFWSGTDEDTIKTLLEHTQKYVVSIVGNHKLDIRGRVDVLSNTVFGKIPLKYDQIPVIVDYKLADDEAAALQADIDTMVKKPAPVSINIEPLSSKWSDKYSKLRQALLDDEKFADSDNAIRQQQIEDLIDYFGMTEEEAIEEVDGFVRDDDTV